MDTQTLKATLVPYLLPDAEIDWNARFPTDKLRHQTPGLMANVEYYNNREWCENYFKYCHRNSAFKSRWLSAVGTLDDKTVVDIGCGPGNVFATLGGSPRVIIGVDVSPGALEMAQQTGYVPLLADAQNLPLKSGLADVVILNATIHHCDDMKRTLAEAARLVAPGGVLVTDHDPQFSAWNFKGPSLLLWRARLTIYLWMKKGFHRSIEEQRIALASEIHHDAGDGVCHELYHEVLAPLGFKVEVYPHNHNLGADVLNGNWGRSRRKYRIAQALSGMNPNTANAALSLMCRATRPAAPS